MNFNRKFVAASALVALFTGMSFALSLNASSATVPFKHPTAIALDHNGHLWVSNQDYFGVTEIEASTGQVMRVINAKADGFIETGPRWIKQMHGGHCRQAYINERGIGICLVGNFSVDQPTSKQLDSLVLLIHGLQEQFHIPYDHILGHGEVIGEFSECPGSQFPWDEFHKRLGETGGMSSNAVMAVPARDLQAQAHHP